jgi:Predicted transcriptional regulators
VDQIRTQRKIRELSQNEVASQLGISRQYYNSIENGRRTPSVELAKKIAVLLGAEWTIFFDSEVNNKATNNGVKT